MNLSQVRISLFFTLIFYLLLQSCTTTKVVFPATDQLKIQQLSAHTYLHVSYLETQEYGNVPCNGMVYINGGEAIIFDTPVDQIASKQLINWIEQQMKAKIKAVVATHFHVDCLGALNTFHEKGIPSYGNNTTIDFAKAKQFTIPQIGFDQQLELEVGKKKVINSFLGEGHTSDNIVCYVPSEKVLFGGCLVKSVGAGKGNLDDANVETWPNTIKQVQSKYPDAQIVIPGHGKVGGIELLDYTIELFNK